MSALSAHHALAPSPTEGQVPAIDREAVAFVLAGWSRHTVEAVEQVLPPRLDRAVVRAQAASWLELLGVNPTAERIDALANLGVRRASATRLKLPRC